MYSELVIKHWHHTRPPVYRNTRFTCALNTVFAITVGWTAGLHDTCAPAGSRGTVSHLAVFLDWLERRDEASSLASGDCNVDRVAPKSKGCVWRVVKPWRSFEKAGGLNVLMCSSLIVTGLCGREARGLWHSFLPDSYKRMKSDNHLLW